MNFSITRDTRNGIDFLVLKNKSNGEYAEIIPDLGATVNKLCLKMGDTVRNILFNDDDNELRENPLFRGRILFPFNDAIPRGIYQFNNKTHKLDINIKVDETTFHEVEPYNLAIHGFVYNKKFKITAQECNQDNCTVTLQITIGKDQMKGYPFNVTLQLTYILREHELKLSFEVQNSGETAAPLSFGWHPYFTFNNSTDNVVLKMDSEKYLETDKTHLPIGSILTCKDSPFDFYSGKNISSLTIDNAVTVPPGGYIHLLKDNQKITIHQDTNIFKYVQLYIPDDHKSIAIESVTAGPNAFNLPDLGLMVLEPGETVKTFASVRAE